MRLDELADKLDTALARFNLMGVTGGINRRGLKHKDYYKDFVNRSNVPYIHLWNRLYVYEPKYASDDSFVLEIWDDDGDKEVYNRRCWDTVVKLFMTEVLRVALEDHINDGI